MSCSTRYDKRSLCAHVRARGTYVCDDCEERRSCQLICDGCRENGLKACFGPSGSLDIVCGYPCRCCLFWDYGREECKLIKLMTGGPSQLKGHEHAR